MYDEIIINTSIRLLNGETVTGRMIISNHDLYSNAPLVLMTGLDRVKRMVLDEAMKHLDQDSNAR